MELSSSRDSRRFLDLTSIARTSKITPAIGRDQPENPPDGLQHLA